MVAFQRFAILAAAILPAAFARPVIGRDSDPDTINDRYIITLQKNLTLDAVTSHMGWVNHVFARSLSARDDNSTIYEGVRKTFNINSYYGYSGHFSEDIVNQINDHDLVLHVEPDTVRHLMTAETQTNATWGLGSISHTTPNHNDYVFDDAAGEGMYAYIIDTGLLTTHSEFEGRAFLGYNAVDNVSFVDIDGHGTHVAGTIGSKTYGVAKKANLISVKVFNGGSASIETILDGYQWAVNNITGENREAHSVISMSLGGGKSSAENNAIEAAYNLGVVTVVAAGNDNKDANTTSPASSPNAVTVGAIDHNNNRATFSNYGSALDIFAPGVNILSTWIRNNTDTNTISGTSMATPHVSGLILYLKSVYTGLDKPADVIGQLKSLAVQNVVRDARGSVNAIAYNGSGK